MSLFHLNYFFWALSLAIAVLGSKNVNTSLGDTNIQPTTASPVVSLPEDSIQGYWCGEA